MFEFFPKTNLLSLNPWIYKVFDRDDKSFVGHVSRPFASDDRSPHFPKRTRQRSKGDITE